MQAARSSLRPEAVEFIRCDNDHGVPAVHRHPLWLTRNSETHDFAEPGLGLPELPELIPCGFRLPGGGNFSHVGVLWLDQHGQA